MVAAVGRRSEAERRLIDSLARVPPVAGLTPRHEMRTNLSGKDRVREPVQEIRNSQARLSSEYLLVRRIVRHRGLLANLNCRVQLQFQAGVSQGVEDVPHGGQVRRVALGFLLINLLTERLLIEERQNRRRPTVLRNSLIIEHGPGWEDAMSFAVMVKSETDLLHVVLRLAFP